MLWVILEILWNIIASISWLRYKKCNLICYLLSNLCSFWSNQGIWRRSLHQNTYIASYALKQGSRILIIIPIVPGTPWVLSNWSCLAAGKLSHDPRKKNRVFNPKCKGLWTLMGFPINRLGVVTEKESKKGRIKETHRKPRLPTHLERSYPRG